ncbi:MAG: hypothetical protein ABIL68_09150 [bacterium]
MKLKRLIIISIPVFLIIIGAIIIYAYSKTWGKRDIEIRIHINEQLVLESAFGESPTFAIWLEEPSTHKTKTVFVTRRAAERDWEGKAEVPVALPAWFHINRLEELQNVKTVNMESKEIIVTGATPKPGYFVKRVSVKPESDWILWIEVNLAGDFNENYKEFNEELSIADEYMTGQPAIIYKTEFTTNIGTIIIPEISGMTMPDSTLEKIIRPLEGITTASDIFDEISLRVVKTKPKILNW